MKKLIILLTIILTISSCIGANKNYTNIDLQLRSLEVKPLSIVGNTIDVLLGNKNSTEIDIKGVMAIDNKNSISVDAERVFYVIYTEESVIASGRMDFPEGTVIKANSLTEVPVLMKINATTTAKNAYKLMTEKKLDVMVKGRVLFKVGPLPVELPFKTVKKLKIFD